MSAKEWYSVELTNEYADLFKYYLRENKIYFEPSSAYNLVHFECLMTKDEYEMTQSFLELIHLATKQ